MACINEAPINEINFLRWHEATDFFTTDTQAPGICGALAYFTFWETHEEQYELPLVTNDEISFFINSTAVVNYPDFADLRLGVMQCGALAAGAIGNLQKVDLSGGYRIYGQFTAPALPDGVYNMVVYRMSNNNVILVSSPVRIINHNLWNLQTKIIKYRNTGDFMYYNYTALPLFYNQFRIDAALNNRQTPTKTKTFTDTWTHQLYNVGAPVMNKTVSLDTYAMDDATHTATAAAAVLHNEFYVDGIRYLCPDGYERENEENDNGFLLSNARAKLQDYNFSGVGVVCT